MAKFDKNGAPISAVSLNNYPSAIARNTDNNQVIAGSSNNGLFVSINNNAGAQLWSQTYTCLSGSADVWYQNDMDNQGNIYLQGMYHGTTVFNGSNVTGDGAYIAKMGSDGSQKWIRIISSLYATPSGIAVSSTGNIYAWGSFSDSLILGSDVSFKQQGEVWISDKLDSDGKFKWFKNFESTGSITGVGGIALDNEQNVLIFGNYTGNLTVEGNTFSTQGVVYSGYGIN